MEDLRRHDLHHDRKAELPGRCDRLLACADESRRNDGNAVLGEQTETARLRPLPAAVVELDVGAQGAEPAGIGVVEGGEIPYLPAALAQKKANYEKRFADDPEIKCYMPGVPRATYLPFPFQILQSQKVIQISYEFAASARTIFMKKMPPAPLDSWMGQSVGHWEGDTLVVDVTGLVDQTWLDRAGDFHSDELHVVERYTPVSRDVLQYEATIEDPKVFSRPWKIRMPLYRHVEKDARLMEFRCAQFVE